MARIENGEHEHRAAGDGPREIGALAGSLNRMVESLVRARREIEARRAAEEALQWKLHRSEKLAALGQVAAGVAHELGTPLSLIDGRAQRLLRHSENGSFGGPLLREIRGQVRRMEQLIRQLLEFGRPSSHNRKRVHADAIAEMAARTVAEENALNGAAIELRGLRPGPELRVDPFRVELALMNLLQNAVHAAPRGQVVLSWSGSGTEVSFTVADDGPGIPPGMESAIFDPFVTTKKSSQGSGLGLCVVQQVAEEHGAKLTVGTSQWGGAEFTLIFPATKGVAACEELNKAAMT
jgi:signal transduction histidine kinase